jgi:hypothetical protein
VETGHLDKQMATNKSILNKDFQEWNLDGEQPICKYGYPLVSNAKWCIFFMSLQMVCQAIEAPKFGSEWYSPFVRFWFILWGWACWVPGVGISNSLAPIPDYFDKKTQ